MARLAAIETAVLDESDAEVVTERVQKRWRVRSPMSLCR
jgi:hypothetical protein